MLTFNWYFPVMRFQSIPSCNLRWSPEMIGNAVWDISTDGCFALEPSKNIWKVLIKARKNSDAQTFEKESIIHIQDVVKGSPIRRFMDKHVFEIVRKNIHLAMVRCNGVVNLVLVLGRQGLVSREVFVEERILREGESSFVCVMAEVPKNFWYRRATLYRL